MLRQGFQQKLQQKLSPLQIQLMKLIQLPTQAFEQRLSQEIDENPALEKGKETEPVDEYSNEESFDESGNESIETEVNIDEYLSDDEIPNYKLQSNNYSADDEDNRTSVGGVDLYPNVLEHLANIKNLHRHPYEFYQKLGYVIVGIIPDANGKGKPDIFMAKRVND